MPTILVRHLVSIQDLHGCMVCMVLPVVLVCVCVCFRAESTMLDIATMQVTTNSFHQKAATMSLSVDKETVIPNGAIAISDKHESPGASLGRGHLSVRTAEDSQE